ncbi:alkyl hydroperoxide reductase [Chitinophaga caeni]|uniref:Alkyl hydroperoxide reductase n=2 Tax=Chitinophaga caeni TaxID=2029983 RepID=A0A291R198_9BACT|nr:alkyl hydroperoxide reductase [Chitinophaga caeni]
MNNKSWWGLLLLLPGLVMAQDKFKISGKISGIEGNKMVVLDYLDSNGEKVNDTCLLKKGRFSFEGFTAYGNKAYLSLEPVKRDTTRRRTYDGQDFYLAKGNYTVKGTGHISGADIKGTPVQEDFKAYNTQMDPLMKQWRAIVDEYNTASRAKDSATLQKLKQTAPPVMHKMDSTLDAFIYNHPDSYVSLDLVYYNKTSVIEPEKFDPIYKSLNPALLESFNGKKLAAKYEKAKQLFIGKSIDFTQTDVEGKEFTLSSLRGQYVLVDFWASWCKPCRAENPNLLKAYQHLKDKNFTIVGVSLDEGKKGWLHAVEQDGMPWKQVSDLKGFKSDLAVKYGITAIPQNVLVDPSGKIIAKNLRGEDLLEQLQRYIK